MAGPYTIDPSTPGDSSIISQFPTNERANRTTIKNFLEEEHDPATGYHRILRLNDLDADPTGVVNLVQVYNKDGVAKLRNGTASPFALQEFVPGTKVVFYQAAAPTGYTQDTSITDRVLRVVSTAGGGTGGTWTISGVSVNNDTPSLAKTFAHAHTYSNAGDVTGRGTGSATAADTSSGSTSTVGSSTAHNHALTIDGLWRPAYADVLVGTKG